jgi:hypothetical protein
MKPRATKSLGKRIKVTYIVINTKGLIKSRVEGQKSSTVISYKSKLLTLY